MIPFYLFLLGCYFFYSRSKYFPDKIFRITTLPKWVLPIFLLSGVALNIYHEGWVSGVLLSVVSCSLAIILVQFAAVLGKRYLYSLALFAHCLILFDLLS